MSGDLSTAVADDWLVGSAKEAVRVCGLRKGCISTSTVLVQKNCVEAGGASTPIWPTARMLIFGSQYYRTRTMSNAFADPLSRYYTPGSIDSHVAAPKIPSRIARRWAAKIASATSGGEVCLVSCIGDRLYGTSKIH